MKIDIIVPIYNAYEYTVKCVESVLENTSSMEYRLILINDKSSDKRIQEYLDELKRKNIEEINIIENEENLGFVGTVNKGMMMSENDVILLNSDTEVTKNWLPKLKNAAYLNKRVATVTPLTNNGTICSIPNFCEDNELPQDLSLDEYADMIEKRSLKMYPNIPTAVGFCMYIKRKVINEIGLFDIDAFGKGYGEENDFCCRVLEAGYINILADDTFIYHKGSTSFEGKKIEYINKNLKILNKRYKYYDLMIQSFIKKNPLSSIHENIKLQLELFNGKKNVLFLLHNDFIFGENHPIGGTEFHVKDLVENMDNINSFVCFGHKNILKLQCFLNKEFRFEMEFILPNTIDNFELSNIEYTNELRKIMTYFSIDIVHVHHFKTHKLDIIDLCKELNIPLHFTAHDYYVACPKIRFLDENGQYCKNIRGKEKCRNCLKEEFGFNTNFLNYWNKNFFETLMSCERLYTPSKAAKDILVEYYNENYQNLDKNIDIIEHGIEAKKIKRKNRFSNSEFKVAFIGGLSKEKGAELAYELIKNDSSENISWNIFGNIGYQKLNLLDRKNLKKHGRYQRDSIQDILIEHQIDLVCVLSIWPETYSYTVSEAIQAEIPILTIDIGALGERIKSYRCGWVLPIDSTYKEISTKIYQIKEDFQDYDMKFKAIEKIHLPTKDEVAKKYEKNYIGNSSEILSIDKLINKDILNKYTQYKNKKSMNEIKTSSDISLTTSLYEENQKLKLEIKEVQESLGWKLIHKINKDYPRISFLARKTLYFIIKLSKK